MLSANLAKIKKYWSNNKKVPRMLTAPGDYYRYKVAERLRQRFHRVVDCSDIIVVLEEVGQLLKGGCLLRSYLLEIGRASCRERV